MPSNELVNRSFLPDVGGKKKQPMQLSHSAVVIEYNVLAAPAATRLPHHSEGLDL